MWLKAGRALKEEKLMKNVFHSFDLDSDGTLKRIEVLRYMKTMDTNKDKIL